jgi:8-oxo-dGTP pyrophosphatase MutT (NUDIX family)
LIENIKENLELKLPGILSWNRMAVKPINDNNIENEKIIRYEELLSENKLSEMKQAAVLICFFKKNGEYHLPLIRRPMHEKNHPGQIALPGGAMEENETLENTALREAFEEVGIIPESVEIIGKMTPLPVPVSKYLISPFIGIAKHEPKWNINKQEVDELIILKFKDLIDSNNGYYEDWDLNGNTLRVPIFKVMNKEIWGATAAVLSELLDLNS